MMSLDHALEQPSAARAELQLLSSNPPAAEDSIRGAYLRLQAQLPTQAGVNSAEIGFHGYWCIYTASVYGINLSSYYAVMLNIYRAGEPEIYMNLATGSISGNRGLEWNGRLLLQGDWTIRAYMRCGDSIAAYAAPFLTILCEKLGGTS
jgi:hypothetical protein